MIFRKKNGVVIFITPDIGLSYDEHSDSLVKQPVTFLYFACDRADEHDYRKVFGLSQREFDLLREWEPEERLALITVTTAWWCVPGSTRRSLAVFFPCSQGTRATCGACAKSCARSTARTRKSGCPLSWRQQSESPQIGFAYRGRLPIFRHRGSKELRAIRGNRHREPHTES
jgi:hypothetical protein